MMTASVLTPGASGKRVSALKNRLLLSAKLAVTVALLLLLFTRMDWRDAALRAAQADRRWLALAIVELLASVVLVAERWRHLAACCGAAVPGSWAQRATFAGQFVGQFLPSTIGGDGARLWFLLRAGRPLRGAAASIVLDRVTGLLGLLGVMLLGLPPLFELAGSNLRWAAVAVASALGGGIAVLFLLDRVPPARWRGGRLEVGWTFLAEIGRALRSRVALRAVALSLCVQLLCVAAVVAIAAALGREIGFADALGIVPAAILLSMVPISINGWGVREGAMVGGLALLGVARQEALLISVLFGLAMMVAALPGSVLWLARWDAT